MILDFIEKSAHSGSLALRVIELQQKARYHVNAISQITGKSQE